MEEKAKKLCEIAETCEKMVLLYGRRADISIKYQRMTKETIGQYCDLDQKRLWLIPGDEYFIISDPSGVLYAVNVTADSLLTAASELMDLLSRKF